jgi:glutaredoxin-related protein
MNNYQGLIMKLFLLVAILLTSTIALAGNSVTATVSLSPAGSFQATSAKMKGKLTKKNGEYSSDKIYVSIESFKTGIDLRDEHFWKHLNPQKKNPKITLTSFKTNKGQATAILEVNAVKKPINIKISESGKDLKAKFVVKNSWFKLPKVNYLGVGVSDDVEVEATMSYDE